MLDERRRSWCFKPRAAGASHGCHFVGCFRQEEVVGMTSHDRLLNRIRKQCLSKAGTTEELPFDDRTLVFKVGGKMFCLLDAFEFDGCGLKCDPEQILDLKASYEGLERGSQIKTCWVLVHPEPYGDVPLERFEDSLIKAMRLYGRA